MPHIDEQINNNLRDAGQQYALDQSKPSSIDETIRLGQEAWARVREGHSWKDWLQIVCDRPGRYCQSRIFEAKH
jgi:hypothetical protein